VNDLLCLGGNRDTLGNRYRTVHKPSFVDLRRPFASLISLIRIELQAIDFIDGWAYMTGLLTKEYEAEMKNDLLRVWHPVAPCTINEQQPQETTL
jgi:hypothetical protein